MVGFLEGLVSGSAPKITVRRAPQFNRVRVVCSARCGLLHRTARTFSALLLPEEQAEGRMRLRHMLQQRAEPWEVCEGKNLPHTLALAYSTEALAYGRHATYAGC